MKLRSALAGYVALIVLILSGPAWAHPLSRGALDVVVHPDRVTVRARVTVEEVVVTEMMVPATAAGVASDPPVNASGAAAATTTSTSNASRATASSDETYARYERHARYLASHLHVTADGRATAGRVTSVRVPSEVVSAIEPMGPDREHAAYELEYPLAGRPAKVELRHDVLVGAWLAPGATWEASYVVRIGVAGGPPAEGLLLTSAEPLAFRCDWSGAAARGGVSRGPSSAGLAVGEAPVGPAVRVDRGRMFREYLAHGVHHILTGYDHLLFISALVLAATGVWDLVKVVTAFTLAHTLTLTLAALRLVSLPEGIVEPMIAASIVFVAAQNVLWPKQSRGWLRLAVAFGFGLFHGLGFAGGLLDAMQAMSGTTILLAIVAFSIGVEVGHQLIVLPLFGAIKLARRTRRDGAARDHVSLLALRYGSAAICLAGIYYLVVAVSSAVFVARHT